MSNKKIVFKSFEQFKQMEFCPRGGEKILFYSRLFGHRDWGFAITCLFNQDYDKSGEKADYIQVQFFTYDIELDVRGNVFANPKHKCMLLKGLTDENYKLAQAFVNEQRAALKDSVLNLSGEYNPLLDLEIDAELLEKREISND